MFKEELNNRINAKDQTMCGELRVDPLYKLKMKIEGDR